MPDQTDWRPIASAPSVLPIDVLYRNHTFSPPVEGVVKQASFRRGFWIDDRACSVPAQYVVGWRPASIVANYATHMPSIRRPFAASN